MLQPRRGRRGSMQAPGELADGQVDYDAHWYVLVDQQQFGPVKFKALAILARREQLRRSDLVWTAGYDSWVPAGTVSSLFAPLPGPSSPSSAPATRPDK